VLARSPSPVAQAAVWREVSTTTRYPARFRASCSGSHRQPVASIPMRSSGGAPQRASWVPSPAYPAAVASTLSAFCRTAPLGASSAHTTWLRLATSIPTTQRTAGSSIAPPPLAARARQLCVAWPGGGLASRVRSPCPWALARPPRRRGRRSRSAIDRARTGGRRGRLLTSVEPQGGDEARRLPATGRAAPGPPRPRAIYKGGGPELAPPDG